MVGEDSVATIWKGICGTSAPMTRGDAEQRLHAGAGSLAASADRGVHAVP